MKVQKKRDVTVTRKQLVVKVNDDASISSKPSCCKPRNEAVLSSLLIALQGSSHRGARGWEPTCFSLLVSPVLQKPFVTPFVMEPLTQSMAGKL